MNRLSGLFAALIIAATTLVATALPASAAVTNARCDPNRPRNDVFVCGYVYAHTQRDGSGLVLEKIRVQSQGDNSELDSCPGLRATVSLVVPSRRAAFPPSSRTLWSGTDRNICRGEGFSRDFHGVKGIRVPARAVVIISYKQFLNFDTDETGAFQLRVT